MKISERFNLQKSQAELDFVDIDPHKDIPLFLDPAFIASRNDNWSVDATESLQSFFQKAILLIQAQKQDEASVHFSHLHEPNATCLGMSVGEPDGNGVGDGDSSKIYESLLKSKAIATGLIQDIEDNILFVDNFGKDKLSDMTTNIIRWQLIEYTQQQCELHDIPLTANVPSGFYWSTANDDWENVYTQMLVINGKIILLVPKGVVSFCKSYTPDRYYNHYVLNFLQNEQLAIKSVLVKKRKDGTPHVTKKDLKEKFPNSKDFLRSFTLKHPEVLAKFKAETQDWSLKNDEISDGINIKALCKSLGEKLVSIPGGDKGAIDFHKVILGVLELLLYPILIYPKKEKQIHQGRKRIDIHFDNAAQKGIFDRLSTNMKIPCGYIYVECKNYSSDPANPELDQLSGRFSTNRGMVGILVCRKFNDRQLFIERCIDTYKDGRGLIIPLQDQDIINLLDNYNERNNAFLDKYLSDIVREVAGA